jgi:hypothetical protein
MRYTPLKWLNPFRTYVSENWTLADVRAFSRFVNSGIMRKMTYEEWSQKRQNLIGQENGRGEGARMNLVRRLMETTLSSDDEESVLGSPGFIKRYLDSYGDDSLS